jgi:hypothetical protein
MQEKRMLWLVLLFGFSLSAQVKGIVVDENNQPIPYVNIWVQNENNGTTSEENGEFSIHVTGENKTLIFSALGYEKKIIKASQTKEVVLKTLALELNEIVIFKRFETKQTEIGRTQNETYQAFDNGPKIDVKFFPYLLKYKKTKYIKKVSIYTDSNIENASIRIHFYSLDADGFPGEELLKKDYIVRVNKGMKKSTFDITDFNLIMPKNGIFVGFEKLLIEKNKIETTITDYNSNSTKIMKTYCPFVLYNYVERENLYTFSGGKWNKQNNPIVSESSNILKGNEPAIYLTLTN